MKLLRVLFSGLSGAACLTVCLVAVGCAEQAEEQVEQQSAAAETAPPPWVKVAPDQMTAAQKSQQATMLTAVNALGSELMGELTAALAEGDAGTAIGVCREKAPQVAAKVSSEFGLEIGRTSHRLRNPANAVPAWATGAVAERVDQPTYLAGPHGELGGLIPIRLRAGCLMCHGPAEQIDETVCTALTADYPQDQAVGFAEGDLRGWFWIKAPPPEAGSDS